MQVGAQQTNRIYIPDFSEPLRSTAPITQAPTAPPSSESLPVQHVDGLQEGDASLRYHRSENTSLKIRTQEGDVVRIRFQTRESAKAELSHEVGDGVESTELKLSSRSSEKLSIRVKGHLNEAELAAIHSAIDQAASIADSFFSGDVGSAFEAASALDVDGDQLARFKLKMRVRESVTYSAHDSLTRSRPDALPSPEAAGSGTSTTASEETGAKLHAQRREAPAGAAAAHPPVDAVTAQPAGGTRAAPAPVDAGAVAPFSEMAADGPAPAISPFDGLRVVDSFLTELLGALGADDGHSGMMDLSLKIHVVRSTILTLAESREESQSVPSLFQDTMAALATSAQSGLERVA